MITKFKKEYLKNPGLKLLWSDLLEQHFVCTAEGVRLEDGTWISKQRLDEDCSQLKGNLLKFYVAGLSVFKDKGFKLCN